MVLKLCKCAWKQCGRYRTHILFIGLVVVNIALAGIFLESQIHTPSKKVLYPEVAELSSKQPGFKELSAFFKNLADEKGAPYAFEVLKRIPTFPNIDMHLLGHIVGDELYKQQGVGGIKVCTQDFRNACSHTIVIGALLEHGVAALPQITETCKQAPGGAGAYTMCFHGLGHGVLAFTEYELPKAIELCKKTGTADYNNREYPECVGGTIMEMIAGVHDPVMREEKSKKYFKADDPLYPCDASFMPKEAQGICYTYLTPHLFLAAGGNLAYPTPGVFKKAFQYCAKVPISEMANRMACYGGLGKEFTVLGAERDVRIVDTLPDEKLREIASWCALAEDSQGIMACTSSVLSSLYWGGENPATGAIRYCSVLPVDQQDGCFANLEEIVRTYTHDLLQQKSFCHSIPASRTDACTEYFHLKV